MKHIAVISFANPFNKPVEGGKNDVKSRILALKQIKNIEVDLYAFNKKDEDSVTIDLAEYGLSHFFQFTVKSIDLKWITSGLPISVYKRFTKECVEELSKHEYDTVIYEGEHMYSYRIRNVVKANNHILRQHDIESAYRLELSNAATSKKEKIMQRIESSLYRKLERNIDKKFDSILFISKEELDIFKTIYPTTKCRFIHMPPATLRIKDKPVVGNKEKKLLYFGNMMLQNNFLSIEWFAKEVLPIIIKKEPEIKLKVIGKITEENSKELKTISPKLEVAGYVDDLDLEINNASIILAPVLFGAGVKVKVIDALAHGQIVCATEKAIEGTDLQNDIHLIVSDNKEYLAEQCLQILNNRVEYTYIAENGLNFVKKYHSIEAQTRIIENII